MRARLLPFCNCNLSDIKIVICHCFFFPFWSAERKKNKSSHSFFLLTLYIYSNKQVKLVAALTISDDDSGRGLLLFRWFFICYLLFYSAFYIYTIYRFHLSLVLPSFCATSSRRLRNNVVPIENEEEGEAPVTCQRAIGASLFCSVPSAALRRLKRGAILPFCAR